VTRTPFLPVLAFGLFGVVGEGGIHHSAGLVKKNSLEGQKKIKARNGEELGDHFRVVGLLARGPGPPGALLKTAA